MFRSDLDKAGVGRPVELITSDFPYGPPKNVPQYIDGSPHNLPPDKDRPAFRQFVGVSPSAMPSSGPAAPMPLAPVQTQITDPYHYAKPIEGTAAVDALSVLVLPEPATKRNYLMIRNSSTAAQVLFVAFGSDANTNSTLRLAQDEIAFLDPCPQSDMYCVCSAAGGQVSYSVSTIAQ
jgi:hypothetical protein